MTLAVMMICNATLYIMASEWAVENIFAEIPLANFADMHIYANKVYTKTRLRGHK